MGIGAQWLSYALYIFVNCWKPGIVIWNQRRWMLSWFTWLCLSHDQYVWPACQSAVKSCSWSLVSSSCLLQVSMQTVTVANHPTRVWLWRPSIGSSSVAVCLCRQLGVEISPQLEALQKNWMFCFSGKCYWQVICKITGNFKDSFQGSSPFLCEPREETSLKCEENHRWNKDGE